MDHGWVEKDYEADEQEEIEEGGTDKTKPRRKAISTMQKHHDAVAAPL